MQRLEVLDAADLVFDPTFACCPLWVSWVSVKIYPEGQPAGLTPKNGHARHNPWFVAYFQAPTYRALRGLF